MVEAGARRTSRVAGKLVGNEEAKAIINRVVESYFGRVGKTVCRGVNTSVKVGFPVRIIAGIDVLHRLFSFDALVGNAEIDSHKTTELVVQCGGEAVTGHQCEKIHVEALIETLIAVVELSFAAGAITETQSEGVVLIEIVDTGDIGRNEVNRGSLFP